MTARPFLHELAAAGSAPAPDWVHLLPDGASMARDGRRFILSNPDAVIAQFQSDAVDLPVDYEHQADRIEARNAGPVRAAGWIKELAARADGIWGRVEWTATAAQMIGAKEYRYLSPSFLIDKATTEVQKLCGAGLVHHPALHLAELASLDPAMPPASPVDDAADEGAEAGLVATLTDVLGLAPDTPLAAVMTALKAMADKLKAAPDPAHYVPVTAMQAVLAEQKQAAVGRAQGKVDAAFKQGYIHGGMRDWALTLCASDEPAFDAFLASNGPTYAHLLRPSHTGNVHPTRATDPAQSETEALLCTQLGLKPGALRA